LRRYVTDHGGSPTYRDASTTYRAPEEIVSAGTILLVEDNPLTRKFVRRALEGQGCAVVEAENAARALGLAGERQVDLVLQDLVLPDMNGFDLARLLRALPACADTPILAFTGFLSSEDEARVSAAGFDGIINKPIEPDRLGYTKAVRRRKIAARRRR
jgi:two-component system, cell cycle response regulator DivK